MNGTFRTAVLWLSLVSLHPSPGGEARSEYGVWLDGRPAAHAKQFSGTAKTLRYFIVAQGAVAWHARKG